MVQPLRRVVRVEPTGRRGRDIGPHCFWLAAEFEFGLECGHHLVRVKDVYDGTPQQMAEALAGGRVRCRECDPVPSRSSARPKSDPERDQLAVRIAQLSMALEGDEMAVEVLGWTRANLGWIGDGAARNRAYAAVTLELVDHFASGTDNRHVPGLRAQLCGWDGSIGTLGEVKRHCRRLYASQHGCSGWTAVRGIVAAVAVIPARGRSSAANLDLALSWNEPGREALLDQAGAARRALDLRRRFGVASQADQDLVAGLVGASFAVSATSFSAPLIARLRHAFAVARACPEPAVSTSLAAGTA